VLAVVEQQQDAQAVGDRSGDRVDQWSPEHNHLRALQQARAGTHIAQSTANCIGQRHDAIQGWEHADLAHGMGLRQFSSNLYRLKAAA
jgi:hypothetical protein